MQAQKDNSGVASSDIDLLRKLMPGMAQDFEQYVEKTKQKVTDNSSDIKEGGEEKKDDKEKKSKKKGEKD